MGRAKTQPTTKVLISVDQSLLGEFDRYWRACGFASRRAGVRHAMELALAGHYAHLQHAQRVERPAGGGFVQATPHSADTTSELAGRPITRSLHDRL